MHSEALPGDKTVVRGRDNLYLFLCRFALMRLRYLCFDIFLLRFFFIDPTSFSFWE